MVEDLDILRDIPLTQIIGIRKTGRRMAIQCVFPNHNDSSPSLVLYTDNSFHCFGCDAHGRGAIDFALALGYDFKSAVRELQDYL